MPNVTINTKLLEGFRFKELFNELGWDRPAQQVPYPVQVMHDGEPQDWALDVVAHKRGVQILHCLPDADGQPPGYSVRQKIERKITPEVREHLIVFTNAAQTIQIWQWVNRQPGKPAQYREVAFRKGETPELLAQKLSRLHFTLDEEELLSVLGVAKRLDDAAPREKVTKKFYTEFAKQRSAFAAFIEGIAEGGEDQRWYTAVVIDRLMFLWFLQEKGFLDGQRTYLQSRLQTHLSANHATSFYKAFLCPLFFTGFAQERVEANRAAIEAVFGKVPYLNGGLFAPHELEQRYGEAIDIADAAFEKLFAFFDEWEWHLDERPLKSGKEINPDVLGYIFEKFVNQKQMGAYYTKEDITEYIGKNTIIPCLLGKVRAEHPGAFDALAWPMLQASGDAYIYPAMLKGVGLPYPPEIEAGRDAEAPDLLTRRKPWNKRADEQASLPTEIWRETIARHARTREVREKLKAGEIKDIGDLITYNLNIRQFAQDLIESCTNVALLKSFWFHLAGRLPRKSNEKFRHGLSVLDPTCGSGAFLFAALGILKPLYDATLRTLQAVRTDALISGDTTNMQRSPEKWAEVDEILERFAAAKTERAQDYQVIKHIIVNNLYGVDIEKQATEIAKLRLFLKLVALLDVGDEIEPLPDIDFNIRHGNTLVGYATADETEKAVKGATQGNLFSDAWEDIRIRLTAAEQQYNNFQIQQVQRGGHVSSADKQALVNTLHDLEESLNYHLAKEYGINPVKSKDYESWKLSHRPFHWFVDFYPLMAGGGFDAIIGNPPYVEYSKIRDDYKVMKYLVPFASNLYAAVCHRSCDLAKTSGHIAQIVPVSLPSTDRMENIREYLRARHTVHFVSFGTRPGKLFDGAEQRLTIFIQSPCFKATSLQSGGYRKWNHEERASLFETLDYVNINSMTTRKGIWPKVRGIAERVVFDQLSANPTLISTGYLSTGDVLYYKNTGLRYFNTVTRRPPRCKINGVAASSSRETKLSVAKSYKEIVHCILLSSTFYSYQQWTSNGRDLNPTDIELAPVPKAADFKRLSELSGEIEHDYESKARIIVMNNKKTGLVELESLTPSQSKNILDEIDLALASSYGLRPCDLDLIVNLDIKYRVGSSSDDIDD
jgi:hypothetical protein